MVGNCGAEDHQSTQEEEPLVNARCEDLSGLLPPNRDRGYHHAHTAKQCTERQHQQASLHQRPGKLHGWIGVNLQRRNFFGQTPKQIQNTLHGLSEFERGRKSWESPAHSSWKPIASPDRQKSTSIKRDLNRQIRRELWHIGQC